MIRRLLLSASILSVISLQAQVYKADTAFTTDIGAAGAKASCIFQPNGNNYGLKHDRNTGFLVGEDFTVPVGQTWNLDTVIIYAYQTGGPTTSTITAANLQIRQSSVTGTVVYGDTTTNVQVHTSWTGIWRVDTMAASGGLTSTQRPIMRVKMKVTPTKTLTAGTYWLIYGVKGNVGLTGPWCPPKVLPGRVNPSGQNGMQHTGPVWVAAKDSISPTIITPVGFNHILIGPQKPPTAVPNVGADAGTLEQNQPNPFTGSTTISFSLPEAGMVKLEVYNAVGQRVATLIDGKMNAGKGEAVFNATGMAAGTYYYRLITEKGMLTKNLQVLK